MLNVGSETLVESRVKNLIERGAKVALVSVVMTSAVLSGAAKAADQAYADEISGDQPYVASISETLSSGAHVEDAINDVDTSSSGLGEGLASKITKAQTEVVSAMPTQADTLLDTAFQQLGVPYVYGGTTPRGFDCSGFTKYCYREALGIELPRSAAAQYSLGESVSLNELQPGDLVFWGSGRGIYHVGIYIGNNEYIHAGARAHSICIQNMGSYSPTCAKRLI